MKPLYRCLTGAAALTAGLLIASPSPAAHAAPAAPCNADSTVKETLPNGTTWQMCWRIHKMHGLVLEKVSVSSTRYPDPVQVLDSITVAQLNVPYDTGTTEYNDITDYGFGGGYLQTLGGDDCKGEIGRAHVCSHM